MTLFPVGTFKGSSLKLELQFIFQFDSSESKKVPNAHTLVKWKFIMILSDTLIKGKSANF